MMLNLKIDNALRHTQLVTQNKNDHGKQNDELRRSINLGYEIAKKSGLRTLIDEEFNHRFAEINND